MEAAPAKGRACRKAGSRLMMQMADLIGMDLRGNAHGHCAAVVNAHAISHRKAAGLIRMNTNVLTGAKIANQQMAAANLQYPRLHRNMIMHGFH